MEIGVLFNFVGSSSHSSNIAFVASTRIYKDDNTKPSLKLYSELPSSGDNIVMLQKRFNFTEDWTTKTCSMMLSTLNYSIADSRIAWFKERLNFSEDDVRKIIKRNPQILRLRSDENVGPTLDFLTDQLMLKPKELSNLVKNNPGIVGRRVETIQQKMNWIESRIVSNEQSSTKSLSQRKNIMKKIIFRAPSFLNMDIHNNLEPKWKTMQKRLDLNETQLAKITIKNPTLFQMNFTTSIEPKLKWLQDHLDLDSKELSKIVQKQPTLLSCDIEGTFEPKLLWFENRLCINKSIFKKMVKRQPDLLFISTVSKMEPIVHWLEKRFALKDASEIGKIIAKSPSLFGCSIENNLEPTFHFFCDCIGEDEAVLLLKKQPMFLGLSLEKRLKPRREQAQQAGIIVDVKCLHRLVKYTEQQWNISMAYQKQRV